MTIFLMVLKKLIKEQLGPLSTKLGVQAKSTGYNKELSLDQKEIVDDLDGKIQGLEGTDDDDADCKTLNSLIDTAREQIKIKREHYHVKEKGNTKGILDDLRLQIDDFYKKIHGLAFKMLNKPYTLTPENIIYFHAIYYFGEEIFTPLSGMDVEIRNEKERKLVSRLTALSKLIQSTDTLDEQRKQSIQTLEDIATDNRTVIKKEGESSSVAVPGISFWGIAFTLSDVTKLFSAGEGRMGQQFNLAARKITELTERTWQPPVVVKDTNQL